MNAVHASTDPAADDVGSVLRREHRGLRKSLAGASLAAPALAVALSWLIWRSALPENLAFHWSASGRADGWFPADSLFWIALAGSLLCFIFGLVVLMTPSRDMTDARKALTMLGTVGAFFAAAWIVPAGATYSSNQGELGAWLVVFVAALPYGLLPRYLSPGSD